MSWTSVICTFSANCFRREAIWFVKRTFSPLRLVLSFLSFFHYSSSRSLMRDFSKCNIFVFKFWIYSSLVLMSASFCLIYISKKLFFFLNSSIFWERSFHLWRSSSIFIRSSYNFRHLMHYSFTGSGALRIFRSYYFSYCLAFDLLLLREAWSISFFLFLSS